MNKYAHDEARYWNEEGGARWVSYLDHLEAMLVPLSQRLMGATAVRSGERVLDIGCGGGPTSAAIADQVGSGGHVLGVDISAPILERARARFGGVSQLEFQTADAGTEDVGEGQFDLAMSRFGVMFFPDPIAAFTNIRRALRPEGRLCVLCWRKIDENPWMGAPAAAAFAHVEASEKLPPGSPGPFSLGDDKHTHDILTRAGFVDVSFEAIDLDLVMGAIDVAHDWLCNMGPAAKPLADAGDSAAAVAARHAMRDVLAAHEVDGLVRMPAAAWIVTARPG